MPELPEVETLCRQLEPLVGNEKILTVEVLDSRLGVADSLVGTTVRSVARQGKSVVVGLDDSTELQIHLRMTGRLQWLMDHEALHRHTRLIVVFSRGRLVCVDPRRFATLTVREAGICGALIPDPMSDCRLFQLRESARTKKLPVKSFLMDQRIIAGLGNIYACEILHEASVNPWREACSLSCREWGKIAAVTERILKRAVECRGTTVSDWRDLFGDEGEYQYELQVYARQGRRCFRCRNIIERLRLSGRGTYFCPSCQK